jgi:hypothetical protein
MRVQTKVRPGSAQFLLGVAMMEVPNARREWQRVSDRTVRMREVEITALVG